ncbi:hypothetical protein [Methylomicrobium lacus]|uniref:hypothetical protein n=1 Tax=Methylomicrobium lacus TaxID=136992 RepID=UPI0035A9815A
MMGIYTMIGVFILIRQLFKCNNTSDAGILALFGWLIVSLWPIYIILMHYTQTEHVNSQMKFYRKRRQQEKDSQKEWLESKLKK